MEASKSQKLFHLLSLACVSPSEFCDRVSTIVGSRIPGSRRRGQTETMKWENAIGQLGMVLQCRIDKVMGENELKDIEKEVLENIDRMPSHAPFGSSHNGDFRLGRLCYALARATRPSIVVETGVCYGVTSAFLLQALRVNGAGTLHSIDLPPLGSDADRFVGVLIPQSLRAEWKLHRGLSKRLLPSLLPKLEHVDLFVHDSQHTYGNMYRELKTITPYLSSPSVVVADDIEGNSAFHDWSAQMTPKFSAAIGQQTKSSLLGCAVLLRDPISAVATHMRGFSKEAWLNH